MRTRLVLGLSVAVALLCSLSSASGASAASPWWHLNSGSRPGNLTSGLAKDEVQELTISATGGMFILGMESRALGFLPFNPTHEEVQTVLEGGFGPGNVQVTGGRGDEQGSKPYVITFVKELADRPVEKIIAITESPFVLEGGRKEASVVEASRGRPDGQIVVTAANLGDAEVNGETVPVRIADELPPGLKAVAISGNVPAPSGKLNGEAAQCSLSSLSCTFSGVAPPYSQIEIVISVVVEPTAKSGEVNEVSISGGQAPSASIARPIVVSGTPTPFGVEDYELEPEEEGGAPDTQAGSHPFQLTTTLTLNQNLESNLLPNPVVLTKDLNFKLPPGLVGNPTPFPQCTLGQFLANGPFENFGENDCSAQTAVGIAMITINEPTTLGLITVTVPLYS